MHFAAEASGVVSVAGEGVVDYVRGVRRGRACLTAGDGWIEIGGMLESSLSSGIFGIDLDFLQAEDMRPMMAG